jgi:C4-type Zn-finger protein
MDDAKDRPRSEAKECPMCGELMRLATRQHTEHVPGQPLPVKHVVSEWICPECDYFEEADGE